MAEHMQEDQLALVKTKLVSGRVYPEFFPMQPSDRVLNVGCGEGPQAIIYDGQYEHMVGVDVDETHIERARIAMTRYGIERFEALQANAESIPLPDASFDRAIAIDVLEHVEHPQALCAEINRLLRPDGKLLITFPTMHDKYIAAARFVKRLVRRHSRKTTPEAWDPDHHWNEHSVSDWVKLIEGTGFQLVRSRATTMFPPLHLAGVPRFWFSNELVHRVDRAAASIPWVKHYGQTLMCVFRKVPVS